MDFSTFATSLLVPTPYTIKMALLKILLESQGHLHRSEFDSWIYHQFTWISDLKIYIQTLERLVINSNIKCIICVYLSIDKFF